VTRTIDELLAAARLRLDRVDAPAAAAAHRDGALLVDIRPVAQRLASGVIPGALIIDRNVLEWRLDPKSDARLPVADSYDRHIILYCQGGYASSLAAATLQDLGLTGATDLIGGIEAWQAAGLPTVAEA
jgi:rhodanese-related sulfurtransferase